jgi:spermidine/putrescine-binding protein
LCGGKLAPSRRSCSLTVKCSDHRLQRPYLQRRCWRRQAVRNRLGRSGLDFDLWVIPKGAPNKEAALEFVKFSTDTQRLADQASWIAYGPARKSSGEKVGLFNDGKTEMAPHMPTAEANLSNALVNSFEFWADYQDELNERFNAWLAS